MVEFAFLAVKSTGIFLRPAIEGEIVNAIAGAQEETINRAEHDDSVAMNLTTDEELYLIRGHVAGGEYQLETSREVPNTYPEYERLRDEGFRMYNPIGEPRLVLKVTPYLVPVGGHCCVASWGETMRAREGDFLVAVGERTGLKDIYRVERDIFFQAYTILDA